MKVWFQHLWEVVSSSYWFVPTVMTILAGVLALVLLYVDRSYFPMRLQVIWLYEGEAAGAQTLLSAVASSVITVAGVVFSITIAALTQASQQFGPRLLRSFMRDRGNQIVLGTFVSTFLYCLLVLRTIHGQPEGGKAFIPQLSVSVGVLMAIASIAVLIYFIHHVSWSLQAPSIVAAVRGELDDVIGRIGELGGSWDSSDAGEKAGVPDHFDDNARLVPASTDGYLQAVNYGTLVEIAKEHDLLLKLECRPGDYLIKDASLLRVWPERRWNPKLSERLDDAFISGVHATPEQDVEFAVRQIVEIAVRSLSPGINDPFTAINCLDALGSALCRISRTGLPGPRHCDDRGALRLIAPVSTFEGITDTAFNQIRQYGRASVGVMIRMLEVIAVCGRQAADDRQRQALLRHAEMTFHQSRDAIPAEADREDLRRRWEQAVGVLLPEAERSAAVLLREESMPPASSGR